MTTEKKSVLELITTIETAMYHLVNNFEDNSEGINLNESDSVNAYPFGESLDETLWKVISWKDAIIDDLSK